MSPLSYRQLLEDLFPRLGAQVEWGLARTRSLLESVGDPQRRFRAIHVGGTNGKGSVAATMESILRAGGLRTGLYTSPHLCTFRERIRIDGEAISADALVSAAERVWPAVQREGPSFFEATTACAFLALADAEVDVAVIEVGLGGRLDATNVVTPEVAVVTNVSMEHADLLGSTLEEVAREKAGIFKAGIPAVTGETSPRALSVLRGRAAELGVDLRVLAAGVPEVLRSTRAGTELCLRSERWGVLALHTPLAGAHQARNVALAAEGIALLPAEAGLDADAVRRGVARTSWPGRLQFERIDGVEWIFDAAHNPAAVESLVEALASLEPPAPRVAVVGILVDKAWEEMLRSLRRVADLLVLTGTPGAGEHRRWDPAAAARGVGGEVLVEEDLGAALDIAARVASAGPGSVLVTGSFYTVGAALEHLGRAPEGSDSYLSPAPGAG